jgi:hypothetical protein
MSVPVSTQLVPQSVFGAVQAVMPVDPPVLEVVAVVPPVPALEVAPPVPVVALEVPVPPAPPLDEPLLLVP